MRHRKAPLRSHRKASHPTLVRRTSPPNSAMRYSFTARRSHVSEVSPSRSSDAVRMFSSLTAPHRPPATKVRGIRTNRSDASDDPACFTCVSRHLPQALLAAVSPSMIARIASPPSPSTTVVTDRTARSAFRKPCALAPPCTGSTHHRCMFPPSSSLGTGTRRYRPPPPGQPLKAVIQHNHRPESPAFAAGTAHPVLHNRQHPRLPLSACSPV